MHARPRRGRVRRPRAAGAAALAADPGAAAAYAALSRSARHTLFLPLLKARTPKTRATALKSILKVFG
ncbi:YdeI/OmpD-associated family protein [Dactylosporangium sp. McL0621]|uniref:YdeI/OmpD-associated family protein n=1 Tax=Dactylosporangium sp. McL0621 TaxID=3415678 RepID=UPI003CF313E3